MSLVQLSRVVRDIEHTDGALAEFQANPEAVLDRYRLTADERQAVLDLDAQRLIDLGLNALLMRTLLVMNGVGNPEIYTHSIRLGASADAS